MTTIAHQGVGVPMSQSRSEPPDDGRDRSDEPVDSFDALDSTDSPDNHRSGPAERAEDRSTRTVGRVLRPSHETDDTDDLAGTAEPDEIVEPPGTADSGAAEFEPADPDAEAVRAGAGPADGRGPGTGSPGDDHVGNGAGLVATVLPFRRPRPQPDRSQLIELYQSQRLRLTRMAILLVDDITSAEDVVQDAFVELHRRWETLVDKEAAIGYLRVSVINKARSALRRRRTARNYSPPVDREHDQAAEAVVLAEEHREVLAAVNRLPPRQREILVLRYWSDLTEAEIAETLGISRGAVKSTASRALDAMERILEGRK